MQVDDELRQKGSTSDMIFKIPYIVSYISSIMTLMEGDVILTGNENFVYPQLVLFICIAKLINTDSLLDYTFMCSSAALQVLRRV